MNWFNKLAKPYQARDMEINTIHIGGWYSKVLEVINFFPLQIYIKLFPDNSFKEGFYLDKLQDKVALQTLAEPYTIYLSYDYTVTDTLQLRYEGATQTYHLQQELVSTDGFAKLFSRCVVI